MQNELALAPVSAPFTVKLRSVGNPDYGQYAEISNPETVICGTLAECVQECRRYIFEWDLGGGNWPKTFIVQNGRKIAEVAYNGSLWEPGRDWKNRKELCAS